MNISDIKRKVIKVVPAAIKVRALTHIPLNIAAQKNAKNAYIFLAANYGNLGDVLITRAQAQYLADMLPDYNIINVYPNQIIKSLPKILKTSNDNTIFTLIGGGNIGDKYKESEYLREYILKRIGNKKIISFPQTPAFKKTRVNFFYKKRRLYDRSNVIIAARDRESFNLFSKNYKKANILLTPDIALYLDYKHKGKNKKILLCLRDDTEKTIDAPIISIDVQKSHNITYHDTQVASNNLSKKEQVQYLNEIIEDFRTSELVITDRLHGMILAKITGTPFIAYDNYNKKISRVYNSWMSKKDGIILKNKNTVIDEQIISQTKKDFRHEKIDTSKFDSLKNSICHE